jgi:pimeloyl-ACP methyl ester carboxylesterase
MYKAERPAALAVHVHGTAGNFYGNPFVVPTAEFHLAAGRSFLTANFPGHDDTAAFEDFDDFTPALDAWLDGYAGDLPIILQGHSLGALKILRYLSDERAGHRDRIMELILLAPFDAVAFYANGEPEQAADRLQRVKLIAPQDGHRALVPEEMFEHWPISTLTFSQIGAPGTVADQFPSRHGLNGTSLERVGLPTFVAIGGADFAAYPNPGAAVKMADALPWVSAYEIPGAPHNFAGEVPALLAALRDWSAAND